MAAIVGVARVAVAAAALYLAAPVEEKVGVLGSDPLQQLLRLLPTRGRRLAEGTGERPAGIRALRLKGHGFAAELDPAIDDLEDLRVAVNELVGILVEAAKGGTILIRMWIEERTIHVSGRCLGEWAPTEPDQLARRILDATVDHHEIGDGAFRMLTHLSAE